MLRVSDFYIVFVRSITCFKIIYRECRLHNVIMPNLGEWKHILKHFVIQTIFGRFYILIFVKQRNRNLWYNKQLITPGNYNEKLRSLHFIRVLMEMKIIVYLHLKFRHEQRKPFHWFIHLFETLQYTSILLCVSTFLFMIFNTSAVLSIIVKTHLQGNHWEWYWILLLVKKPDIIF